MLQREDYKSERINFEVSLFKGCTLHEMMLAAFIGFSTSIVCSSILFLLLFDSLLLGIAFGIPIGFGIMLIAANSIGTMKQNKPQRYYQHVVMMWLEDKSLCKTPFVRRSGKWSIRRIQL